MSFVESPFFKECILYRFDAIIQKTLIIMKKLTFFLAFVSFTLIVNAQTYKPAKKYPAKPVARPAPVVVHQKDESFSVLDKNFLDPGVGLGTYYKGLPFGISFEHGFTDDISAGAFVNYSSYNYADFGYKLNIVYAGVRGSYHFAKLFNVTNPKFDPYGGVGISIF